MNKNSEEGSLPKITFYNKIGSTFRQVHVDGAFGGISPKGLLNLNFFSERFAIPKQTEYVIKEDNSLDKIKDSDDSKEGVIREYEFGVLLNLEAAKRLEVLLQETIKELEKLENNNANPKDTEE